MGNEMTKEDWQRKDMLNSRMSALKAASFILEGSMWSGEDVKKQADEYYEWLTQDQNWTISEVKQPKATPTLKQKELLEAIAKKLGISVDEVIKHGKLPNNQTEAKELYQTLKG